MKSVDLFTGGKEPHFYIQTDFGFLSDVTKVVVNFGTVNGAVLPTKLKVYTFWDSSYKAGAPSGADAYRTRDEIILAGNPS